MKKIVKEWIYKAEEDFESATHLARKRKNPVPDVVCFHSQQCIEKCLKAFLAKHQIEPPEVHDLQRLRVLCANIDKDFDKIREYLDTLNAYAVNFRYPGEEATLEEAKEAIRAMKKVKEFILKKLK